MKITNLWSREVLDSRGNPTVAVTAEVDGKIRAEAFVPSGASTGTHEALELRDGDPHRFGGLGVLQACRNVEEGIFPILKGMDPEDHIGIDQRMLELDGTAQKSRLGANAILGVSLAVAHATAKAKDRALWKHLREVFDMHGVDHAAAPVLPKPMMNILNGGVHANNGLDVQEFMIVPQQKTFAERLRCGAEIFHALKEILSAAKKSTAVGDEGGFAPHLGNHDEAWSLLRDAVNKTANTIGTDVVFAVDVAANEFFRDGAYVFEGHKRSADDMRGMYAKWCDTYDLHSIEDGFAEDDWESWKVWTTQMGASTMLVGDDLFVTNTRRLQRGIDDGVANAILIKINQIGTLTETIAAVNLARQHGYEVIISHRSGETEDTTIADLAVAVDASFIKTGSCSRSERVAKYNRLLAIEKSLSA